MTAYRTHRFSNEELNRFEPNRNRLKVEPVTTEEQAERKRGRKSTKAMIQDMASALQRADYALGRIRRLEEQIAAVLRDVGRDAATLVLSERPSLKQYLPKSN
jgi:hypothetical protein